MSLTLVNLHVRVPRGESSPLDKRGDSEDAKESPLAALVTFWLTSLAGSSPCSRMGSLPALRLSFPNT